jgi:two-component system sensor histidine kinase HydH
MAHWYGIQSALLAAIICGALAIHVLLGRRTNPIFGRFAAFNLNLVAWFLVDAMTLTEVLGPGFTATAHGLVTGLLPASCVTFFVGFAAEESRFAAAVRRIAQFTSAALVLAACFPLPSTMLHPFMVFVSLLAALIASVTIMLRRTKTLERRVDRIRLNYLTGTGAVCLSVPIFGHLPGVELATLGNILVAIYMFFVFQVITRRRLLDIFEFVGRFVVIAGFALVLSLIYVLLVAWSRIDLGLFVFNTLIAAIVILILYDPLRNLVEQKLNQFIFREKFEFQRRAEKIRDSLRSVFDVQALANMLLEQLHSSRRVTHAGVYLFEESGLAFTCLGSIGTAAPGRLDAIQARPFLSRLKDEKLLVVENLEAEREALMGRAGVEDQGRLEVLDGIIETMHSLQTALAIGFVSGQQLLGFLNVKDERLREAYATDEIRALVAIAGQATITIENSRHFSQIREKDRLAALGEMAAGLAHEIRNPLGAIKGAAQLVTENRPGEAPYLGIINEEVNRLDGVVSQFLSYARPLKESRELVDINQVLERTLTLIHVEDHGCEVELVAAHNLPAVRSDPELLRQVILNLSRNAIQAMEETGGKLLISTALTRRRIISGNDSQLGERVSFIRVRFQDEGPGIPPEVMERLFIPFFTTKSGGTGLGLAICQRLIRSLGGTIEVTSRLGEGTTFTIYLPAHDGGSRTTTA